MREVVESGRLEPVETGEEEGGGKVSRRGKGERRLTAARGETVAAISFFYMIKFPA